MKTFTFFKIKREVGIPDFDIEPFKDEEGAKRHAHTLLGKHGYKAIEIWDGKNSVRVTREDWLNQG